MHFPAVARLRLCAAFDARRRRRPATIRPRVDVAYSRAVYYPVCGTMAHNFAPAAPLSAAGGGFDGFPRKTKLRLRM